MKDGERVRESARARTRPPGRDYGGCNLRDLARAAVSERPLHRDFFSLASLLGLVAVAGRPGVVRLAGGQHDSTPQAAGRGKGNGLGEVVPRVKHAFIRTWDVDSYRARHDAAVKAFQSGSESIHLILLGRDGTVRTFSRPLVRHIP